MRRVICYYCLLLGSAAHRHLPYIDRSTSLDEEVLCGGASHSRAGNDCSTCLEEVVLCGGVSHSRAGNDRSTSLDEEVLCGGASHSRAG